MRRHHSIVDTNTNLCDTDKVLDDCCALPGIFAVQDGFRYPIGDLRFNLYLVEYHRPYKNTHSVTHLDNPSDIICALARLGLPGTL